MAGRVYIREADSGQRHSFLLRLEIFPMDTGDKFEMTQGTRIQPIPWCYWVTKEEIIKQMSRGNRYDDHFEGKSTFRAGLSR